MTSYWWLIHPVGITTCATLAWATFVPHSGLWGRIVRRAPTDRRAVALTFDDGPTPGPTDRVLDLLADAGVSATFFVVGQNARKHPGLLRRIDSAGHLIGNHTFDHSHVGVFRRRWWWDDQLRRTDDAIADVIGRRPALFRAPMGHKTPHTLRSARALGCQTIGWTVGGGDGLRTTADNIVRRVGRAGAGDIVVLHDGIEPNSPRRDPAATLAALPTILGAWRDAQLPAERLDTLLGVPGYR